MAVATVSAALLAGSASAASAEQMPMHANCGWPVIDGIGTSAHVDCGGGFSPYVVWMWGNCGSAGGSSVNNSARGEAFQEVHLTIFCLDFGNISNVGRTFNEDPV
jgi:hypothetical protein